MHKFTNTLTPAQVYRYAVECCQPHLKLRDAKRVTARMLLTILFAAAARISSLSDTCKRLRGVPDEEVVAAALYETLPDYKLLKRQVNAALAGHLPKPLRKQAQIVALDLTLLPFYGADAKENDQIYRSQAKRGTCSFYAYASVYIVHKGQRYTVALMAVTRKPTMEDVTKELLRQVRKVGIHVRFLVLDRGFYSVAVIRYLQAARMPFLMPVVGHGRKPDHPLGPSGSQVFKAMKRSGWFEYTLSDPRKRTATVQICVKCRNRRGARQEGPGALDLRLLGHRPQAVRLGQGHLPEPIRGRDQLSPDEPVSDSDDDDAVRSAVLVRGDRVPDAEPVGVAPLCGPVEPPSRLSEV